MHDRVIKEGDPITVTTMHLSPGDDVAPCGYHWDPTSRRTWLSTCRGADLGNAAACLLSHVHAADAEEAAADAEALFANPELEFDHFAEIVYGHLAHWSVRPWDEGDSGYRIDPRVVGAARADWWARLLSPAVSGCVAALPRWWHRVWVLRRAFVVAEPDEWTRLWQITAASPTPDMDTSGRLLALLRHRSLPAERHGLLDEDDDVQARLLDGWDQPWDDVREEVPARTTREQAQASLSRVLVDPAVDRARTTATTHVRRALVAEVTDGRGWAGYGPVDRRFAVLTPDDLRQLISTAGPCTASDASDWSSGPRWHRAGAERARTTALGLVALDDACIAEHLECPVAEHRVEMVLNPFVPADAAARALAVEIESIPPVRAARTMSEIEATADTVAMWWRILLAVRGWLPSAVLEPAMHRVSQWMVDHDPLGRWLPNLAVYASSPDGLRSMSSDQLAHFDAVVGARANGPAMRWAPHRWGKEPDPHTPLMSAVVLRQILALTGWKDVRLILDPAVAGLLPRLPVEPRVLAARHGDDGTLRALVDDPERRVRQHVARNRRASVDTLTRLLDDHDPRVRSQVARNLGVTPAHLARMSRDPDRAVSHAASRELLKRLAAA